MKKEDDIYKMDVGDEIIIDGEIGRIIMKSFNYNEMSVELKVKTLFNIYTFKNRFSFKDFNKCFLKSNGKIL